MSSTPVFLVLLLSQIFSCFVAHAAFVPDVTPHGGPVNVGGVVPLESNKTIHRDPSLCYNECLTNSKCVIAIFSRDSCTMYGASSNGTNFTLEVDYVVQSSPDCAKKAYCEPVVLQYTPFNDWGPGDYS